MTLNARDKLAVRRFFGKLVDSQYADIGADTLNRLIKVFPQTKTYFNHWPSLEPGSEPVMKHGKDIMEGVVLAVDNIDDIIGGLVTLSELHAYMIRVDPTNFRIFSHCFLVVLAIRFPNDLTPEVHVSIDKFLGCVAGALSEKYR